MTSKELEALSDDAWVFKHLRGTQAAAMGDEELKYTADRLGTIGGMQDDIGECFDELWRRYNNKKKECESMKEELQEYSYRVF